MNKIIKIIGVLVIILFLSLYFSGYNNYYYESKKTLTTEAIKQYEKDLKSGKKIDPTKYIEPQKNYNNKASTIGMKTSIMIEKGFNICIKFIVEKLLDVEK